MNLILNLKIENSSTLSFNCLPWCWPWCNNTIGIAQLNTFSCANNSMIGIAQLNSFSCTKTSFNEKKRWKGIRMYKNLLTTPPVLCLLIANNEFRSESVTSKTIARYTIFQFQQGQLALIGFHWKKWSLEFTGLVCNMHSFGQLLKHRYFEVLLDLKATETYEKAKINQQQIGWHHYWWNYGTKPLI